MGLEKDQEPPKKRPLFYSGKDAVKLRFPDLIMIDPQSNKKIVHKVQFITFPHWVHKIQIDDKIYEVLGKDLQIGMPILMSGQLFIIVNMEKIIYHGLIEPKDHPMGYFSKDWEKLPKYKFRRIIKGEEDHWVVEEDKPFNEYGIPLISDDQIDLMDADKLNSYLKNYIKSYSILLDDFNKLKRDYNLLSESLQS